MANDPKQRGGRRSFVPTEREKQIAARIRRERERLGWSQLELAKKLGTTDRSLSRYETLRAPIPTPILLRMQEYLGNAIIPGVEGVAGAAATYIAPGEPSAMTMHDSAAPPAALSPEEKRLLSTFRELPRDKKDALLGRAVSLLDA